MHRIPLENSHNQRDCRMSSMYPAVPLEMDATSPGDGTMCARRCRNLEARALA